MAPHWKCGSGQPVAGSNPALSAISARRRTARPWMRPDASARGSTSGAPVTDRRLPEIVPLEMAEFRFADDEPLAGQAGVVMAYVVRHRDGVLLFDTGFGFGNADLEARYQPRARRLPDVLEAVGIPPADVTTVVNCHLHVDHAGQNAVFPGVPIYVQPAEWDVAHTTDHTILEWIDFPGARYVQVAGDHELVEGIRIVSTPGHTPGHQSLMVETAEGRVVLAGQAVYTAGEWSGDPDAREGRSQAPDQAAYDASVERLRALDPVRVHFGHDRLPWTRDTIRMTTRSIDPTGVSFGRRARRGTSGALYLQSAPAGLNSLPRSLLSYAARRCDVEDRVPRSGEPRTVSGPEGSSTKRSSSGAAERPGPSRSSWWAREFPGRRRVHGKSSPRAPHRRRS